MMVRRLIQFYSLLILLMFAHVSLAAEPHDYFYVTHRVIFNAKLKQQLELTPQQLDAWDNMEDVIEQAHETIEKKYVEYNDVVSQEASKFTPNIDTIYVAKQALEERILQTDKRISLAKVALYESLTQAQRVIIKNLIFSDALATLSTFKDKVVKKELNLNLRQRILWNNTLKGIQKTVSSMQKTLANKNLSQDPQIDFSFVEEYHQLNVTRLKMYLQLNRKQQALLRQHWFDNGKATG